MKAANFFTTKEAKFPCVPVPQFATYSAASLVFTECHMCSKRLQWFYCTQLEFERIHLWFIFFVIIAIFFELTQNKVKIFAK